MKIYDTLIIGAGPCGIRSAIILKEAGLDVAVFEYSTPGGKINIAPRVDNYPGFTKIPGPDLAMEFFNWLNKAEVEMIPEEVTSASQFFVIKSFSEEDVHKSIKYKVWSSSKNGNNTLSNAFRFTQENKGHVYLFFSCNGSGRYVGVARMTSPCDENKKFDYWTQDNKWPGLFDVEWIYIKDVPFKEFKNIMMLDRITMKKI